MRKTLGAFGESWAAAHLERLGYTVLARNVRFRTGEIDIVARENEELVFIEVKCRRSDRYGLPEEAITRARYQRLAHAIDEYLYQNSLEPVAYRVDVVALQVDGAGRITQCRILRNVETPA